VRALRSGGKIAVVSPAGSPKVELVERGVLRLQELGYRVQLGENALARGPMYYAGDAAARVSDLHAAFADESVDGIVCTRGGWGSAELLPHLDADLIAANAKPFVGYSDITSLAIWMRKEAGLGMFYGPMVAADFARGAQVEDAVHLASWRHALEGSEAWQLGSADGLRALSVGVGEGELFGGCISILAESLGTPNALTSPSSGGILFLEDVGTRPYQWDRLLLHMEYAGVMEGVRGIVLGDMGQCIDGAMENDLLERALHHRLDRFNLPIAIGLRCGHVDGANITLPLGAQVRLSVQGDVTLEILTAVMG